MKQNKSFASLILILLIFCISGCYTRNENIEIAQPEITELKAHQWYYFSKDGFIEIDLPQNAPDTAGNPSHCVIKGSVFILPSRQTFRLD